MHSSGILHCVFLLDLISPVPIWIKLTPGLKTPECDSRVREALTKTQRRDSLYLCPQSSPCHSPLFLDSHQTTGSPSMPPDQSLRGQGDQSLTMKMAPSSGQTTYSHNGARLTGNSYSQETHVSVLITI